MHSNGTSDQMKGLFPFTCDHRVDADHFVSWIKSRHKDRRRDAQPGSTLIVGIACCVQRDYYELGQWQKREYGLSVDILVTKHQGYLDELFLVRCQRARHIIEQVVGVLEEENRETFMGQKGNACNRRMTIGLPDR